MPDSDCVAQHLRIPWQVVTIELGTVVLVGLVVLFLELFGEPTKRGFFCNDESIKYPFQKNTLSEGLLIIVAILLPFIVIAGSELWADYGSSGRVLLWKFSAPKWAQRAGRTFGFYMVGLGLSQIISAIGKFTIGRLRPHFLAVCQPDIICNASYTGYVTNYTCMGNQDVMEARASFPSGHASVSFFQCIYLIVYLQQSSSKWRGHEKTWIGFFRVTMQFVLLSYAWWVSLTRITDYWHHWSDVLAGLLLGIIAAILTVKYLPGITVGYNREDMSLPLQTIVRTSYESS